MTFREAVKMKSEKIIDLKQQLIGLFEKEGELCLGRQGD